MNKNFLRNSTAQGLSFTPGGVRAIAQGTIEYLVILSIIVVIGLIVVALISNMVSSPATTITSAGTKLSQSSGGINIVDAVIDKNGKGLLSLSNNTGGTFTITKLNIAGSDSNYGLGKTLVQGENGLFKLDNIGNACDCSDAVGKTKKCTLTLYGLSEYGLLKTLTFDLMINCIVDSNQAVKEKDVNKVVAPIVPDNTPPVVYLLSPSKGSYSPSRTIDFNFNVSDSSSISRCELFVNGVSDTNKSTGLSNGVNTINRVFTNDLLFDWNVSCFDSSSNKGDSNSTWNLDINADPLQITSCVELQNMNNNRAGAYTLMNDINCYGSNTWNSNTGFIPIGNFGPNNAYDGGGDDQPFTGSLTGNNHIIRGLYDNRPSSWGQGLFGLNDGSASVSGVRLVDANVWGNWFTGGIVGMNRGTSTITNCSFSGNVVGTGVYNIGGLFGGNWGSVTNSFSTGTVSGTSTYVGGLGGNNSGTGNVMYNYSTSTVSGAASVGGLIGYNIGSGAVVRLSYATGNVTGTGANVGGLIGQSSGNTLYSFSTGRVTAGSVAGGLIGSYSPGTITSSYWYDQAGDSASTCYSSGGSGCTTITDASWFYYDSNQPMPVWGTWGLVSGNKYSTGLWSICRGAGYPWFTYENRTC